MAHSEAEDRGQNGNGYENGDLHLRNTEEFHKEGAHDTRDLQEVELGEAGPRKDMRISVGDTDETAEGDRLLPAGKAASSTTGEAPGGDSCRPGASGVTLNPRDWINLFRNWQWSMEPFHAPYGMHLALSVALNAALGLWVLGLLISQLANSCTPLGALETIQGAWALPAVTAAAKAFALECSGNGEAWTDTVNGQQACECHQCYSAPDCSVRVPECTILVASGNPTLFRAFWKANAPSSSVLIPGHYRVGYFNNGREYSMASRALEDGIRRLHTLVGNAVVEDRHLVIGQGSTLLINAAMYALADRNDTDRTGAPMLVTAPAPFYQAYGLNADFFHSHLFAWGGPSDSPAVQAAFQTLEFVTSPNNPDGRIKHPTIDTNGAHPVYDLAYYWPHFTPITEPADHAIMLFTLSKLSGHGGTRIGWALVKDKGVATRMQEAVTRLLVGVSQEAQLRAATIINAIADRHERLRGPPPVPQNGVKEDTTKFAAQGLVFSYATALMQDRWQRLQEVLSKVDVPGNPPRFSLQELGPAQYCTFFKATLPPTPAYAWVRCNYLEDKDCYQLFRAYKVIGRAGTVYGAGQNYVRLSLLVSQSTFDILMERLPQLLITG